jgi:hypothetical protein
MARRVGGARDGQRQVSSSGQGGAELSRTAGLLWSEMDATPVLPPSCEELEIGGMGRLQPGAGLECWTCATIVGSMLEWAKWSWSPLFSCFILAAL